MTRSSRRPGRFALVVIALAVAVCIVGAGCARNDGRTMAAPPPGVTTPPPTTGAQVGTAGSVPAFSLSSSAFTNGGAYPEDHTCDGAGGPPPLTWTAPPSTSVELALVLVDADAANAVLWVVAGLPPQAMSMSGGVLPTGAVDLGYQPPCPEPGDEAHLFVFTLYGLPAALGIDATLTPDEAVARIGASPAQAAQLTGSYVR